MNIKLGKFSQPVLATQQPPHRAAGALQEPSTSGAAGRKQTALHTLEATTYYGDRRGSSRELQDRAGRTAFRMVPVRTPRTGGSNTPHPPCP